MFDLNQAYCDLENNFLKKGESFSKHFANINWFSLCRLYYLLIPEDAFSKDWQKKNVNFRQMKISEHLKSIDFIDVNRNNLQIIDKWTIERLTQRKKFTGPTLELLKKYHSICYFCGKRNNLPKHVDHVFPKSRGGSSTEENAAIICSVCNQKKSNLIIGERFIYHTEQSLNEINETPSLLSFYVFLRDNFSCKKDSCQNGILNGSELFIGKKYETGILSFDNLVTKCEECNKL